MAAETVERTVAGAPGACYEALSAALPELGYTIWKTRPIAYLVQARGQVGGHEAMINAVCSLFAPTKITVTCEGDGAAEALHAAAEAIAARAAEKLGEG